MSRVNPLDIDDLSDFAPRSSVDPSKPVASDVIDEISRKSGFPSRQPTTKAKEAVAVAPAQPRTQRRYVTGRNQQINIKAKAETIVMLNSLADKLNVPLGEVLERALYALDVSLIEKR
jgi:hypothetical protein